MNSKTLTNIYAWGIKLILFLIPFVTLFISTRMFFPYITGRNFTFRILVEIALVLWVGLIFLDKKYRPKISIISIAVLAMLVIVGIADFLAENPFKSFWSNYERMEGYIGLLHLGAYFFLLGSVFKKNDWLALFHIFGVVGVVSGFWGLLQKLGYLKSIQGGFRADGPIGNPAYFAAYLMLVALLMVYLFVRTDRRGLRYLYGIVTAFLILIVFFSATRGALLALSATLIMAPVIYLLFGNKQDPNRRRNNKLALGIFGLAIVIPVVFWLMRGTSLVKKSEILDRLASISLTEGTSRSRFMVWDMAWQGVKERPVFGWGQEGFLYVFSKYYNPKMYDQEPWFDRSHNLILDWLVSSGFAGLASYLFLVVSTFIVLFRLRSRGVLASNYFVVLVTGLLAYLLQNLFVFDNLNTYLVFFAIIAYLHSMYVAPATDSAKGVADPKLPKKHDEDSPAVNSIIAGTIALVVIAPAMYLANIKPIKQSLTLIDALSFGANSQLRSDPNQARALLNTFEKALSYDTFGNSETIEQVGQAANILLSNPNNLLEEHRELIGLALDYMEKYLEKFPFDARMRYFAATVYNRAAQIDPAYIDIGLKHIERALKDGPNRQNTYLALAENLLSRGQYQEAINVVREAIALAPEFPAVRAALAQVAILTKHYSIVDEVLAAGREKVVVETIANIYFSVSRFADAVIYFEELIAQFPDAEELHARVADAYVQVERYDDAIREAKKLAEVNPFEFEEKSAAFIANVEKLKTGK